MLDPSAPPPRREDDTLDSDEMGDIDEAAEQEEARRHRNREAARRARERRAARLSELKGELARLSGEVEALREALAAARGALAAAGVPLPLLAVGTPPLTPLLRGHVSSAASAETAGAWLPAGGGGLNSPPPPPPQQQQQQQQQQQTLHPDLLRQPDQHYQHQQHYQNQHQQHYQHQQHQQQRTDAQGGDADVGADHARLQQQMARTQQMLQQMAEMLAEAAATAAQAPSPPSSSSGGMLAARALHLQWHSSRCSASEPQAARALPLPVLRAPGQGPFAEAAAAARTALLSPDELASVCRLLPMGDMGDEPDAGL